MDAPIAIASLEMAKDALGERFARQMHGSSGYTRDDVARYLVEVEDKYWVYDETTSIQPESALGMAVYAAAELDAKHVIIDSLVKCGLSMDQRNASGAQRDFVDELCAIAKAYQVHIHLVHHMRKGNSEREMGDKMDVKGAGELTDMCDNLLLMWRNKPKEDALSKNPHDMDQCEQPDCYLTVAKQRHGEWEGSIPLWYDINSMLYREERR
jgi:twinkle protein